MLEESGCHVFGQPGRFLDDPAVAAAHGLERDERRAGPEGRILPAVEAAEVEEAGPGRRHGALVVPVERDEREVVGDVVLGGRQLAAP